jgi:three-Cys-motif partner protein
VEDVGPAPKRASRKSLPMQRLWTESKAQLIERYLFRFLMVTKDGTYIDGFAGPQDEQRPETWAARLVLELEPPWLRHFHLFERKRQSVLFLNELRRAHANRDVNVYPGDFNRRLNEILTPEIIGLNEPTFALLDQRTFECDWASVCALANYPKAQYKIEQFYFLAIAWTDRAVGGAKEPGRARMDAWYGKDGVDAFLALKPPVRAAVMTERFKEELSYAYANPYAIHERKGGRGRRMYYMIHATDHPRAVTLMDEAYGEVAMPARTGDELTLFED